MALAFRTNGKPVEELIDSDTYSQCVEMLKSCLNDKRYDIVITGTVGSGKSTVCDILLHMIVLIDTIRVNTFPEFVSFDGEFSERMLDGKIRGSISQLTFQSYILDAWEQMLKRTDTSNAFNIYERCADDSVACFCNIANKDHSLTDNELIVLYERLVSMNNRYSTVSFFDPNTHFTEITEQDLSSIVLLIVKTICSDIANGVSKRIIGLAVSSEVSAHRIASRGRSSESGYPQAIITLYQRHYQKLFKYLSKHGYVERLIDFGKLV